MEETIPSWVIKAMTPLDHKRDCMAFCRDFYIAIRLLPNDLRLEAYDAIMDYSFQERMPQEGSVGRLAVGMVEGKIDLDSFEHTSNKFEHDSDYISNIDNIYKDITNKEKRKIYKKKKEKGLDSDKQEKFDLFWKIYDRKEGKKMCEQLWEKLCEEDVDMIIKTVPLYVRWKSDVKYRKMPATYLRQRCWEDDIPNEFTEQPNQVTTYQPPKDAVY